MSDPIDRLSGFASSFEGEIMPRTAADARRRGDTIRRRRHALVAAGSAAAVVAVALPVFAFANGSDDADAPFGPATKGTSGTVTLSADNLLADGETESYDGTTPWVTKDTSTGGDAEQDAAHPCVGDSLGKLGAGAVVGRDWQLDDSSGTQTKLTLDTTLHESVAQFDDPRAARSAYDEIAAAMPDCSPLASTFPDYRFQTESTHDIKVPEGGTARFFAANYHGVQDPEGGGYTHVLETGLVVSGARLAVLTFTYAGQDFWPQPMDDMVPVASQRLVTGTGPAATTAPPTTSTSPPQAGSGVTTAIPDDIPIDLDLVDMGSDGDYQAPEHVPASDFEPITLCSTDIWPPAHVDALSAWATGPEYSDRRDLLSFNSVDDAVAAVQGIRDDLQGCTRSLGQDVTVHPTDTGYDSVTFSTACPAGGPPCLTMYQVTRVGNAVLMTAIYGEYSTDAATHVANVRTDVTKNIATHLCVFTADGCSSSDSSGTASSEVPLGPDGYGDVKLGMSVDQALATGDVVAVPHAHGGDTYSIAGDPTGAELCFTPGSTLHAIFAPHGVSTPEGIGVGSTRDQLAAAYPSIAQALATSPDLGVYDAPTGDGADYRFDVERNGHVSTVILLDDQQQCFD